MQSLTQAIFVVSRASREVRTWESSRPALLTLIAGRPLIYHSLEALAAENINNVMIVTDGVVTGLADTITKSRRAEQTVDVVELDDAHTANIEVVQHFVRACSSIRLLLIFGAVAFDQEALKTLTLNPNLDAVLVRSLGVSQNEFGAGMTANRMVTAFKASAQALKPPSAAESVEATGLFCLASPIVEAVLDQFAKARGAHQGRETDLSELLPEETKLTALGLERGCCRIIRDSVDVDAAEFLLRPAEERADLLERGVGGYWRRPIQEHILLCNTRFPPSAFFEKIKQRLADVLSFYPSAQDDVAEQVARMTGQPPEHIAVGNGVTDLIKALYATLIPQIAIPTPTFAGFQTPLATDQVACFELQEPLFDLNVDDFANFAMKADASIAVVVNPNNPTGRLVDAKSLIRLHDALGKTGCRLVIDESFIDFPLLGRVNSLEPYVGQLERLVIFKSLGKVYGLGGIRLGYMLSGDRALVKEIRRALPMWNINGLAEYALCILPEFMSELQVSLSEIRHDRQLFEEQLRGILGMHVVPSETNYVFCRLPSLWPDGSALKRRLVLEENVLVRECAYQKMKAADRFLRLTVRSPPENTHLVAALRSASTSSREGGLQLPASAQLGRSPRGTSRL